MGSLSIFLVLIFLAVSNAQDLFKNDDYFGMEAMRSQYSTRKNVSKLTDQQIDALRHKTLRVIYMPEPPYVIDGNWSENKEQGIIKNGSGVIMEILRVLAERYALKYELTRSEDGIWGQEVATSNGTMWTGVIGKLHRQEFDLVAGAMIVDETRTKAVDFSYPFMATQTGLMIRSPQMYLDKQFLIIKAPFNRDVWISTAASVFISAFILKLLCRITRSFLPEVQYSLIDAIWAFYAIFVQQDLCTLPRTWAIRTMFAFWWLAAMTLVATFTGNMMAMFAVSRSMLPFDTVEELVAKIQYGGYKVVLQNSTTMRIGLLERSHTLKSLWTEMRVPGKWVNVSTLSQGMQMVIDNAYHVFLAAKEPLEDIAAPECRVISITVDEGLMPVWLSIAFRIGSPYKALFSQVIESLNEGGVVEKWLNDYKAMQAYFRGINCKETETGTIGTTQKPIGIERAQGAFWLLLIGVGFAVAGFALEQAFVRIYRSWAGRAMTEAGVNAANGMRRFSIATVTAVRSAINGGNPSQMTGIKEKEGVGSNAQVIDITESSKSYRPVTSFGVRKDIGPKRTIAPTSIEVHPMAVDTYPTYSKSNHGSPTFKLKQRSGKNRDAKDK